MRICTCTSAHAHAHVHACTHAGENERLEEMAGARAEQARLEAALREAIDARDEAIEERADL